MSDAQVRWVATLSNGVTAVEHSGEYQVIPGERKPWVRLTQFLVDNDLHLTSFRLNFRGRTIHLPRQNFDRFSLGEHNRAPLFYSLAYIHEADIGDEGMVETEFVDLVAHYELFEVHFIQDITDGNNSWVTVTQDYIPLAPTQRNG